MVEFDVGDKVVVYLDNSSEHRVMPDTMITGVIVDIDYEKEYCVRILTSAGMFVVAKFSQIKHI